MQRFRTAYSPKDQKESLKDYDLGLKTILDKKPVASVVDVEMHQDGLRGKLSSWSLRVFFNTCQLLRHSTGTKTGNVGAKRRMEWDKGEG